MGDAALDRASEYLPAYASWALRLAQQAFAQLLEDSARHSGFRVSARRMSARAALSALSVDDRGPLEHWLALQVLCASTVLAADSINVLATVDAALATAVRGQLAARALDIAHGTRRSEAVAA